MTISYEMNNMRFKFIKFKYSLGLRRNKLSNIKYRKHILRLVG